MLRLASLCLLLLLACTVQAQAQSVTVFRNVNVLPMDSDRVLDRHTVVVEGERIVAVGPAAEVAVPEGATVIDGRGQYLLPGLAEMHGHVPPPNAPAQFTNDVLFLYLANGITTVRGMLGADGQLALRERANTGALDSPTLYLAGPSFNGNSVSSPEQAAAMVQQQVEEGWDVLKIHPGLTRAEYDAMARAAHAHNIRFGGHVPAEVGLWHALAMGQETFDHVDGYVEALMAADPKTVHQATLDALVSRTREAGAWIVPTMALWEVLYGTADRAMLLAYDELKYMPTSQVEAWTRAFDNRRRSPDYDAAQALAVIDARMRVLEALNNGGARLLMGTDAPQLFSVPGFSLHREMAVMEAAGMTPYDVLRSGTFNVGEYFKYRDAFGTVTPGKRADLILAPANPLESLDALLRPTGVMVRGRWFDRATLDARLADIEERNGS